MIVVDTDVISYFWLEQESMRTQKARDVRRKDADWVAPTLWRSEFRSVLRKYLNVQLLELDEALFIADAAERDLAASTYDVSTADVLVLVAETGHSAYDCEYVALARALGLALVTGDVQVARQFPKDAVLLEGFAR